jgi:hypothetical protein
MGSHSQMNRAFLQKLVHDTEQFADRLFLSIAFRPWNRLLWKEEPLARMVEMR